VNVDFSGDGDGVSGESNAHVTTYTSDVTANQLRYFQVDATGQLS